MLEKLPEENDNKVFRTHSYSVLPLPKKTVFMDDTLMLRARFELEIL